MKDGCLLRRSGRCRGEENGDGAGRCEMSGGGKGKGR